VRKRITQRTTEHNPQTSSVAYRLSKVGTVREPKVSQLPPKSTYRLGLGRELRSTKAT